MATIDGDELANILVGTESRDLIRGFAGSDKLDGGAGRDRLEGGEGADVIDGGEGSSDAAEYRQSSAGVTVSLLSGTGSGGDAEGDVISNVERLVGSKFADKLSGDDANNVLVGLRGDDVLYGLGGNDRLVGGNGADMLFGGEGNDRLEGGAGADLLDGGDGTKDVADYRRSDAGVNIDLEAGTASGGHADGDVLIGIERLHGSNHNDVLTGDSAGNVLNGRNGDDILNGGGGNDVLNGGNGDDELFGGDGKDNLRGNAGADFLDGGAGTQDRVDYNSSKEGVIVNLETGTGLGGDAEGDVIVNVEWLYGSKLDDVLTGDAGNNRLVGRNGDDLLSGGDGKDKLFGGNDDDVLDGGAGADVLNGGNGSRDTADYRESDAGVQVNLDTGSGVGGHAEGDRVSGIEDIRGSQFADMLTGNDVTNRLMGNEGDDALFGMSGNDMLLGGEGADHLDGGDGIDTANYQHADAGVGVNLSTGGFNGEALGDTFVDIEFVYASEFNDEVIGDDLANRLNGQQGDDVLVGAGGNDTLIGGTGNDIMTGGEGYDLFLYDGAFDNDQITDFWGGDSLTDRIWFRGMGLSEADLVLTDTDEGALIVAGEYGSLLLQGVDTSALSSDDFLF